jgi:twitching motility protein PilJ
MLVSVMLMVLGDLGFPALRAGPRSRAQLAERSGGEASVRSKPAGQRCQQAAILRLMNELRTVAEGDLASRPR